VIELDAREVAGWPTRLSHPVCSLCTLACGLALTLRRDYLVQQPTTIQRFKRRRRKAAHSEWKLLQWGVWVLGLLQHQDREVKQAQLASEKQADGASAGNYNVIDI
jgi:hypothetical protein